MKNRTVILGAGSGFIGKELTRHLKKNGNEVLPISSKDIDLLRKESVGELKSVIRSDDYLVFASAITPDKGKDTAAFMKNMSMAENVGAFLEQSPCAYVLYISSDGVYADGINPIREDSPCDSGTLYGHMHRARELVIKAALAKSKTPHLIFRPCAVYGAQDTHNGYGPNRFLRSAKQQKKISLFGEGEEKRDHVYIGDVCNFLELCLSTKKEGIFNFATGEAISFHDLAVIISKMVGSGVAIETSSRANPITHRHFDITSLRRAFPLFKFTDLKDGLTASLKEPS